MKQFRILFYRPAIDGKWIDNAIGSWTWLWNMDTPKAIQSSHEEIWTPDDNGKFTDWLPEYGCDEPVLTLFGQCWTSTMGQIRNKGTKYNGACVRPAGEVLHNPERWFYAQFEVCDGSCDAMIKAMQEEVKDNKGYDTAMILNFFLPVGIGSKDKWICSEFSNHHAKIGLDCRCCQYLAYENFKVFTMLKDTFSPMRTANTLRKLGVKFYELTGQEVRLK